MAKKTTVKSGSKKKTAAKKKPAASKKTAAKAGSTAKSKDSTADSKAGSPKTGKSTAPKKLSVKDLIMKKFDAWKPEKLFIPVSDPAGESNFHAPPFSGNIRKDILLRRFDFDFADVACVPPPPREELIRKKFPVWKPKKLFVPKADKNYEKGFRAPSSKNISKNILMRKFDFDFADVAYVPPPPREELIRKKFAAWKPENLFIPAPDTAWEKGFAAPGFGDGIDKKILMRRFDFDFAEEAAKARAEAEKKAAEAAAKAKAEAERKAAEAAAKAKAEAERKEAERKAAEEAAKAKAEAERKAAEEAAKAKAEAERIEAERKAARPEDPLVKMARYAAAVVILLFSLIIAASYSNSSKYYLEPTDIGIQIWQGRFAPMGEELLVTLKGREAAETIKAVYTKEEISAMAFGYFMEEADAMMKDISYPPMDSIKAMLKKSLAFAIGGDQKDAVKARMNTLNLMGLLYQSDIAASNGNPEEALGYLKEASRMNLDAEQAKLLTGKSEVIRNLMTSDKGTASEPVIEAEKKHN